MRRTIDIIDATGLRELDVTGFRLGLDLDAPLLTRATYSSGVRRLPAAGHESPPCNDGTPHTLPRNELFTHAEAIGDTGAEDVSHDRDCHCDSHVRVRLANLRIEGSPTGGGVVAPWTFDGDDLCPNMVDGDLISGDKNFDSPVDAELTATLRVAGGRLLLDVRYTLEEIP
jgi:hypothetical protein